MAVYPILDDVRIGTDYLEEVVAQLSISVTSGRQPPEFYVQVSVDATGKILGYAYLGTYDEVEEWLRDFHAEELDRDDGRTLQSGLNEFYNAVLS